MKTTASILLVVLLTHGPGGSPGPAMALQCPADFTISNSDEAASITVVTKHRRPALYLHPAQGFEGVTLVVDVAAYYGNEVHDAWFPMEDRCFQGDAEWWEVEVKVSLSDKYLWWGHWIYQTLILQVKTGACRYWCVLSGDFESLQVKGYGPSGWRYSRPDSHCGTIDVKDTVQYNTTFPTCQAPPPPLTTIPATPTTSTPTTTTAPTTTTTTTTTTPATTTTPPTNTTATVGGGEGCGVWRPASSGVVMVVVTVVMAVLGTGHVLMVATIVLRLCPRLAHSTPDQ